MQNNRLRKQLQFILEIDKLKKIVRQSPLTDQSRQLRDLWNEFEARQTPEACFAAALDRLQPLLLNFHTQGGTWREHDIRRPQVIQRNSPMHDGAPKLWEYAEKLIQEAVEKGMLKE